MSKQEFIIIENRRIDLNRIKQYGTSIDESQPTYQFPRPQNEIDDDQRILDLEFEEKMRKYKIEMDAYTHKQKKPNSIKSTIGGLVGGATGVTGGGIGGLALGAVLLPVAAPMAAVVGVAGLGAVGCGLLGGKVFSKIARNLGTPDAPKCPVKEKARTTIDKKNDYLYITEVSNENHRFYTSKVSFDIYEKRDELDRLMNAYLL